MQRVVLDARKLGEREKAHVCLRELLDFPQDYGCNLDALFDLLCQPPAREVVFTHTKEAGEYFRRVLRVFQDAAEEGCLRVELGKEEY